MADKHLRNSKGKKKGSHLKKYHWKKGDPSPNPKGRPPGKLSITATVKEVMEWQAPEQLRRQYKLMFPDLPDDASCHLLAAVKIVLKSLDMKTGDVMAKEIWERVDGKVPFPISGAPGGDPIRLSVDLTSLTYAELQLYRKLTEKAEQAAAIKNAA